MKVTTFNLLLTQVIQALDKNFRDERDLCVAECRGVVLQRFELYKDLYEKPTGLV